MNLEKLQVETLNAILDTISKLPGFNDEIADFILSFYPYQGRYENEINISFHALALRKVTAQRQLEIYKKARALPPGSNANYFTLIISASINDNENINPEVETLILTENYKECLKTQDFCYLTTFTGNKKVQNWMVKYLDFSKNPKFVEALTYKYNYTGNQQKQGFEATPELTIQILNSIFSSKALLNSYSALGFLETAEINATVLEKIRSIYENLYKTQPNSDQLAQLRHILFKNKDQIPDLKPYEIEGLKATQKCTTNGHSSSCYWKTY